MTRPEPAWSEPAESGSFDSTESTISADSAELIDSAEAIASAESVRHSVGVSVESVDGESDRLAATAGGESSGRGVGSIGRPAAQGWDPLFGPEGLRPGWRLLLWVMLFVVLYAVLGGLAQPFAAAQPGVGFALVLAASTLAGWGMLALQGRRPGALGWALDAAAVKGSALGFALGAVLIVGAVGVLAVAGSVRWVAAAGSIPEYAAAVGGGLGFFAVAAAAEESLLRGYGFQALVEGIGPWPATLLGSAVFAAMHAFNPGFGAVAAGNIFLAGVLLALLYLRTRSLWVCTGTHLGWNWAMSVMHFPVSGLNRAMPLYRVAEHGAQWLTGGAFGPEAGAAATLAVAAGIAWTLRTGRLAESPRMAALRPLVDARLPRRWPR